MNNKETLEKDRQHVSLSPEITNFLDLFVKLEHQSLSETPKFYLEKLQENLRIMKNQQTKDFYKLYGFKSNFSEIHQDPTKLIEAFLEYWKKIQNQSSYYQKFDLRKIVHKNRSDKRLEVALKN